MNGIKDQKIPATIATVHAHKLTITITKQCGGAQERFTSTVINLEHN